MLKAPHLKKFKRFYGQPSYASLCLPQQSRPADPILIDPLPPIPVLTFAKTRARRGCIPYSNFSYMVCQSAHIPGSRAHFDIGKLPKAKCFELVAL